MTTQDCIGTSYQPLALDYAEAFLADVNWYEIAKNNIEAYRSEEAA